MTVYRDYRPDEQQLLLASLDAAAVIVSAASPGRKAETVSEGFAAAQLVLESQRAYVDNTLVSSVILELDRQVRSGTAFPDYTQLVSAPGALERGLDTLRAVVALLDARATPDEAAGYKRWLMQIATATAEAGKEDQGFLASGGVRVNAAEREALAQIAALLGLPEPDSPA